MAKNIDTAVWCGAVTVTDSYGEQVELAVYQDKGSNGVFAVDASFIEQEEPDKIPSPFDENTELELTGD